MKDFSGLVQKKVVYVASFMLTDNIALAQKLSGCANYKAHQDFIKSNHACLKVQHFVQRTVLSQLSIVSEHKLGEMNALQLQPSPLNTGRNCTEPVIKERLWPPAPFLHPH